MTRPLRDILFPVIRAALGEDPVTDPALTAEDCDALLEFGYRQALLPVLLQGVKRLSLPEDQRRRFEAACDSDLRLYVLRDVMIERIGAALESAAIDYLPLKGTVIRALYPEPWMRTCKDVDILVREADLDRAVKAVEAATFFQAEKKHYHDVSMRSPQLHLELHCSLKEDAPRMDPVLERVWEFARPVGGTRRYEMTPEYLIFHNLAHTAYHVSVGGVGVRAFLDLRLLRAKTRYDEEKLRGLCRSAGLERFYDLCCALIAVWMEDLPHTPQTALMESYCLRGGVFGTEETTEAAKQREHRGISFYYHYLFLRRELLESVYPNLKRHPCLLGWYQLIRWTRLFNKEKRAEIRERLQKAHDTDKASIQSYAEFLQQIGL